jgi:hypothetical protein
MESDLKVLRQFLRGEICCYIPDASDLLSGLKLTKADLKGNTVTIPTSLFKFLLSTLLVAENFDEAAYLAANSDVAEAVRKGQIESGWVHYVTTGYFEGRSPGAYKIDVSWYRKRYPDVARAERRGQLHVADHYARVGRAESRAASAGDERYQAIFKAALRR